MDLLYRIVYAAHANGSHHKLALESLRHLSGERAEPWRRLFLKHAELYLTASKVPDNEFKDFKNHVLHVADGYWGGAPEKAVSWYDMLLGALREQRWSDAVYAAGILSHYYSDPHHPFHTGQSAAENNIHRAVEWSISKSFDELLELGRKRRSPAPAALPAGDNWLTEFICRGAERSNAHYAHLIAHYDFSRGVVDPPSGLDAISKEIIGDLIIYTTAGFALVLDRAIAESQAVPPEVELTTETIIAALKIPVKWVTKKLADATDRRQVESMYDELMATGRVEKNLPEDDRAVRDLHAAEVLTARAEQQKQLLRARLGQPAEALEARKAPLRVKIATKPEGIRPATSAGVREPNQWQRAARKPRLMQRLAKLEGDVTPPLGTQSVPVAAPAVVGRITDQPATEPAVSPAHIGHETAAMSQSRPSGPVSDATSRAPPPQPVGEIRAPETAAVVSSPEAAREPASIPVDAARPARRSDERAQNRGPNESRRLTGEDDVVDAPSVGPRTAGRFYAVGIYTVADLLAAEPGVLAERLATKHITARVIADWQSQTRLVCDLPGLKAVHAQLLVGAGFRTFERLLAADAATLQADVLRYAATGDGQRVLRQGEPPDLELIAGWIELARQTQDAEAA